MLFLTFKRRVFMKKLGLSDILKTERCILKIPEESETEEVWDLIDDEVSHFMNFER